MRKWLGVVSTGVLVFVLLGTVGCVKSKLPPAPTVDATKAPSTTTPASPTATVGAGETVVVADPTSTSEPGASPTPIPTMTPTTAPGSPTNTPAPTATTAPEATPTTPPTSGTGFEYTVETGDTLWGLALRFGTTVEAIKSQNSLTSDAIFKGDVLIIPGVEGGEAVTHVVQAGENMFRISLKYGTTVQAIAAANGIINPNYVYVGQELSIPQGTTSPGTGTRYHVVQPGETLSGIAMKYGTTPWSIAAANGVANVNFIYAGRTLRIP